MAAVVKRGPIPRIHEATEPPLSLFLSRATHPLLLTGAPWDTGWTAARMPCLWSLVPGCLCLHTASLEFGHIRATKRIYMICFKFDCIARAKIVLPNPESIIPLGQIWKQTDGVPFHLLKTVLLQKHSADFRACPSPLSLFADSAVAFAARTLVIHIWPCIHLPNFCVLEQPPLPFPQR
jgi:hypothetical protein